MSSFDEDVEVRKRYFHDDLAKRNIRAGFNLYEDFDVHPSVLRISRRQNFHKGFTFLS